MKTNREINRETLKRFEPFFRYSLWGDTHLNDGIPVHYFSIDENSPRDNITIIVFLDKEPEEFNKSIILQFFEAGRIEGQNEIKKVFRNLLGI